MGCRAPRTPPYPGRGARRTGAFSQETETASIYSPELDIIVFPTTWTSKAMDRVVFHEVGHALTFHQAEVRLGLLRNLPPDIARHLQSPHYGGEDDAGTLRRRCLEALAEAYVHLVTGRAEHLSGSLLSELMFILTAVAESDDKIRLDFGEDKDPSALRVPKTTIVGRDHPELGWLLAPEVPADASLEAHELADDELSCRRRRRHAA